MFLCVCMCVCGGGGVCWDLMVQGVLDLGDDLLEMHICTFSSFFFNLRIYFFYQLIAQEALGGGGSESYCIVAVWQARVA